MLASVLLCLATAGLWGAPLNGAEDVAIGEVKFSRHASAIFSRLGCNGGTCHGSVQGKNGFRLSLFGAKPADDFAEVVRDEDGRRIDLFQPEQSLLLLKPTGQIAHGGGTVLRRGGPEYELLRRWIADGAAQDDAERSQLVSLAVTPRESIAPPGQEYRLSVVAEFTDGSREDVTALCSYQSLDEGVATVGDDGRVQTVGVGDATIIARFRAAPVLAQVLVPRESKEGFPEVAPLNWIDEHVLAKLKRLNVPPSDLCDDATFLRRARLDVTGQLPTPDEVRAFLADQDPAKRKKKIDALLAEPGYAALWTMKFCDLLKASDFGVYADGLAEHYEAPRFQAWVRRRMEENIPYDEFAARILTATSRDGRTLEEWSREVIALQEGYDEPRTDLDLYAGRKSLDIYWQRKDAIGVPGAMQVAHAFLGLRLECAQCHRHPHDVWQQDDLLDFADIFMRVRRVGFEGDNEKKYPEAAALFKQFTQEGKKLEEEAKKLTDGRGKELAEKAKQAQKEVSRLKGEIDRAEKEAEQLEKQAADLPADQADKVAELKSKGAEKRDAVAKLREEIKPHEQAVAENDALQKEIREMTRRGKLLGDEISKRVLHAQVFSLTGDEAAKRWANVESPLGSQSSREFRLLGQSSPLTLAADEDPRERLVAWLRDPENPFFARAIVNRVWAHYFGRGIINPPDDLSPFNPPTHPELLDELARQFVANKYDLKWLHRAILNSRTYQQSSIATAANEVDRANYAYFYFRRLPAEVLLDALDQATGTREKLDMKYYHWPDDLRAVELPYMPKNAFLTFALEQFGRPARNSAVQCDCQRQSDASLLQILTLANHPRVWQKVADPAGRAAAVAKQTEDAAERIEEIYLSTLGRLPDEREVAACREFFSAAPSPEKGLQAVLWSLINTKEFLLQH